MSENLAVILMVVCVIAVVLGGTITGIYRLDRAVDETAPTPHPHPAE
jgi:hypothetical protein